MKKKIIAIVLIAILATVPAFAIFGIGDIVFDPSNYQEAIQQFIQLERQYAQLVLTYAMIQNQYNEMLRMARQVPVNMFQRYRAVATPWTLSSATNIYGTSGPWASSINGGLDVFSGYANAVQPLGTYGSALGSLSADQQDRVKKSYATVELTDGAIRSRT